jgi:hypothetical protein
MKGLLFILALGLVSGQEATTVITVNDPRPLGAAIMELEKASGQPISYEDAPFAYAGDLIGLKDPRAIPGAKIPKGGPLTFPFGLSEVAERAGTAKVLQRLVRTFNMSYPDGAQFTVLDQDGMLYVVPKSSREASGVVASYTSPLDVPLSVTVKDALAGDALREILSAIQAKTGSEIYIAMSPFDTGLNVNGRKRVSISTQTDTGRTLVTQLMKGLSPWLSWRMLTGAPDPRYGNLNYYYLNIQQYVTQR